VSFGSEKERHDIILAESTSLIKDSHSERLCNSFTNEVSQSSSPSVPGEASGSNQILDLQERISRLDDIMKFSKLSLPPPPPKIPRKHEILKGNPLNILVKAGKSNFLLEIRKSVKLNPVIACRSFYLFSSKMFLNFILTIYLLGIEYTHDYGILYYVIIDQNGLQVQ
jgi:hypothetical protein